MYLLDIKRSENSAAVLPFNTKNGSITHDAAENLDIKEGTLNGKNIMVFATSIGLYQKNSLGSFGDIPLSDLSKSPHCLRMMAENMVR